MVNLIMDTIWSKTMKANNTIVKYKTFQIDKNLVSRVTKKSIVSLQGKRYMVKKVIDNGATWIVLAR